MASAQPPEPLRSREVFLDTEAYRRLGFDTTKPSILALLGHITEDRLQLHLTDITSSEIRRQIAAEAQEATEEIKRARGTAARWARRAPKAFGKLAGTTGRIDGEAVAREAFEQFRRSLAPFVEHYATRRKATDIFAAYFDREPPFDGQGGKSVKEFPDAFVIAALDDWCTENNTLMYVVTNDKAMLRAADARGTLIPVETLDSLLEIVTIQHSPDVIETVETILEQPDFEDQLSGSLEQALADLEVVYMGDLVEGEASDPALAGDPTIVNWTVISAFDKSYGLIIEVDVNVIVQVHYDDLSMASYDSEDGIYVGAEPAADEIEEDVRLRMFIQVNETCAITRSELLTSQISIYGPMENYK